MRLVREEKIACPLCQSGNWSLIDRINTAQIDQLYQHHFGIKLADIIEGIEEVIFLRCKLCTLMYFHPPTPGTKEFYAHLSQLQWYFQSEKYEYKWVASIIPPGARVLDVGCGNGAFSDWISQCQYVGIDANYNCTGTNILPETVSNHSESHKETYDFVCLFQVLEHVVDINEFIEKCLLCLRPGGSFIISVPAADSFVSKTINNTLNLPPHHLSWWPDTALQHLAILYDLSLDSLTHEPLERIHYGWYSSNWALGLVSFFFKHRSGLINTSLSHNVLMGFLRPLALLCECFLPFVYSSIRGHSVLALYRKGNG